MDLAFRKLGRHGVDGAEGNRAGRDRLPSAFGCGDGGATFPGTPHARLASCVRQLDSGHGAELLEKRRDAGEEFDVFVFPDALIEGRDASARFHGGGFHHDQGRAADRAAAEMDQVPVVGEAVFARILAHGGNGDAVAKCDAALGQRLEEVIGHRFLVSPLIGNALSPQQKNCRRNQRQGHRHHKPRHRIREIQRVPNANPFLHEQRRVRRVVINRRQPPA